MKFKVLLIKPNILVRKGFFLRSKMCPPIGLAYVAASLKKAGYETEIIDMVAEAPEVSWLYRDTHVCYGLSDQELVEKIKQSQQPHLIGIGGFTCQYSRIKDLTEVIKRHFPDIPIVLGGINATALPRYVLETTKADYLIQAEAESAIVELAKLIEAGDRKHFNIVDGLGYKADGKVIINPKVYFENNLDSIPWPARELLNHKKYIQDSVAMPVITSRGCPNHCTFCSIHCIAGPKWRPRNPNDVVDEIEDFVKQWGYKNVSIFDDAANVIPQRLITIFKEIVRRKIKLHLTFPGSLMLKNITKELLYWMKRAGGVALGLPIEHANKRIRDKIIGKYFDDSCVCNVLDWCREVKLLTIGYFVIGMPTETEETLQEMVEYMRKYGKRLDAISLFLATPFPGTALYKRCIEEKLISDPVKDDFLTYDTYTMHIKTKLLTNEQLLGYKERIEKVFLEVRGSDFPAEYIRTIIRKPDAESVAFVNNNYFK